MNRHILFTVAFTVFAAACMPMQEKIILRPAVENNATNGMLEIAQIERTDSATLLYFDAYQRPKHWIKIASSACLTDHSGKQYRLIRCNGIALDSEVYAPESGHIAFTLAFEPLDKSVRTVDFQEGDQSTSFRIKGIQLYSTPQTKHALQCVLKGEVENRPYSRRLILARSNEDLRTSNIEYIPIRDGRFEYALNADFEEMYELTFYDEYLQGAWRPVKFFCEADTLRFTLFPADEYANNSIEGGRLNSEYRAFDQSVRSAVEPLQRQYAAKADSLRRAGKYYSAEAEAIHQKISKAEPEERDRLYRELNRLHDTDGDLTSEANALRAEGEAVGRTSKGIRMDYMEQNRGMAGYAMLVEMMFREANSKRDSASMQRMTEIFNTVYATAYPAHPYTARVRDLIGAVRVGSPYIDVTAVDAEGNRVRLSELIEGKMALIYLWASWCGPCRRTGKELIPVYEAYRDKGFTVVGIAREKNIEDMIRAAKQDGHPWLNLAEINDQDNIWNKYGTGNAGGGDFLVDDKGVIVAVNPTADEVLKKIQDGLAHR